MFIRWLKKLFGVPSEDEVTGISIKDTDAWMVTGPFDSTIFFTALSEILPEGAVIYFEGTSIANDVKDYLLLKVSDRITKIQMGTIWPRPKTFHIQATLDNLAGLAELTKNHAEPEICDHLVVYKDNTVLLEAHDWSSTEYFLLSGEIPTDKIRKLCSVLGCQYSRLEEGD